MASRTNVIADRINGSESESTTISRRTFLYPLGTALVSPILGPISAGAESLSNILGFSFKKYLHPFEYSNKESRSNIIDIVDLYGSDHTIEIVETGIKFDGIYYKLHTDKLGGQDLTIKNIKSDEKQGRTLSVKTRGWFAFSEKETIPYEGLDDMINQLLKGKKEVAIQRDPREEPKTKLIAT